MCSSTVGNENQKVLFFAFYDKESEFTCKRSVFQLKNIFNSADKHK